MGTLTVVRTSFKLRYLGPLASSLAFQLDMGVYFYSEIPRGNGSEF